MNLISIQSSMRTPSASLFINHQHIKTLETENLKSSRLAGIIQQLLNNNNISSNNLDYIALGIGPGTFTGIRVGLSLAQGMAFSIGIPILPINTMDVLNEQVKASDIYIIAVHSHKEYVFCKKFNTIKNEKIKLKSIAQMGYNEDIYGIDLEHSQINFNYHSLKLSSREIGKYGLKNYKILAKNNIASIKPIYLNEYKIDYKV